jgi:hypothetical protein
MISAAALNARGESPVNANVDSSANSNAAQPNTSAAVQMYSETKSVRILI